MVTCAGIDLSLTSTGLCVRDEEHLKFYFYPNRKREQAFRRTVGTTTTITAFAPNPSSKEILARYIAIRDDLLSVLRTYPGVVVYLEGYAFSQNTGSGSKLQELGGIIKLALFEAGISVVIVPPTRVKKQFTGDGRADKYAMYAEFQHRTSASLMTVFGWTETNLKIPNPVQDLVDAFALSYSATDRPCRTPPNTTAAPRTSNPKRRRIV